MIFKKQLLLYFFFCAISMNAQNLNTGEIKQKKYFEKIPYTVISEQILIPVTINNRVYNFHLDTGAPFAISEKLQKELGLSALSEINLFDINQKSDKINTVVVPELTIGGITFMNSKGMLISEDIFMYDCLHIDGIIGSNVLRNSVLQFDDMNQWIYITNDSKNLRLQKLSFEKLLLSEGQSSPHIKIYFENDSLRINTKALIDSGANHFFSFPSELYESSKLELKIFDALASHQGANTLGFFGIADKSLITLLRVPELIINQTVFKDVIFETNNGFNPNLGNQLFKYGKTTIDYKKKRFYFEPYANVDHRSLAERPFAVNPTFYDGKFVIDIIWHKSLESQINVGDEILSYDGIDYTSLNLCDFIKTHKKSSNNEIIIELKDVKTGQFKTVKIKRA